MTSCWVSVLVLFSLKAVAACEPNKSFPISLVEMLGGAVLIGWAFISRLLLLVGRKTGTVGPNKVFWILTVGGAVGGGGRKGCGDPSKKSSIVGKLGGSPPGPKGFELLLFFLLLLLLLLLLEKVLFFF